jgi:NDP-sugar pyrophosphorylase family protein
MKAVVLAGGQGARLAPFTKVLPKPLLPVGERPVLEIIVRQLRQAGVSEVVIATGYLSRLIETFFGDGSAYDVPISYVLEPEPLGTIGPLALVDGLDETFLLMNGDVLTSNFYPELMSAHRRAGAIATVSTRLQEIHIDYGVLSVEVDGAGPIPRVRGIQEKPSYRWPVSMGVYAFEPRVLDFIEAGAPLDFPEFLNRLVEAGEYVASFEQSGYWMDVGQLHNLEAAVKDYEGGAERFSHDLFAPSDNGGVSQEARPREESRG